MLLAVLVDHTNNLNGSALYLGYYKKRESWLLCLYCLLCEKYENMCHNNVLQTSCASLKYVIMAHIRVLF